MTKAPRSLLIALVAAMGTPAVMGYALSASSAAVIDHIGITAGQIGVLASISFATAAVGSRLLGGLADSLGVPVQMAIIHGFSIIALVLAGLATGYPMLVIAALLGGVGLAFSNPTTNRILIRQVPTEQRGPWIGVKQSGVQFSQLFAALFFPPMILWLGWPAAAAGGAVVILLLWLQAIVALRSSVADIDAPAPATAEEKTHKDSATPVPAGEQSAPRREPMPASVWFLAGISLLSGTGMQAMNVYIPLFGVESLGYGLVIGGLAAAVIGVVGVLSRMFWGARLQAGARPTTLFLILFIGAISSAVSLVLADTTGVRALLWVSAALLGASTLGVNVVVNASIMRVVAKHRVGAATGITAMGMFAGFASGPLLMGVLRDATGDFGIGWIVVTLAYALALGLSLMLRSRWDDRATS